MIREFWAYRTYYKENYQKPKVCCTEHLRHLYDPLCVIAITIGAISSTAATAGSPDSHPGPFYKLCPPDIAYYLRGGQARPDLRQNAPLPAQGDLKVNWTGRVAPAPIT